MIKLSHAVSLLNKKGLEKYLTQATWDDDLQAPTVQEVYRCVKVLEGQCSIDKYDILVLFLNEINIKKFVYSSKTLYITHRSLSSPADSRGLGGYLHHDLAQFSKLQAHFLTFVKPIKFSTSIESISQAFLQSYFKYIMNYAKNIPLVQSPLPFVIQSTQQNNSSAIEEPLHSALASADVFFSLGDQLLMLVQNNIQYLLLPKTSEKYPFLKQIGISILEDMNQIHSLLRFACENYVPLIFNLSNNSALITKLYDLYCKFITYQKKLISYQFLANLCKPFTSHKITPLVLALDISKNRAIELFVSQHRKHESTIQLRPKLTDNNNVDYQLTKPVDLKPPQTHLAQTIDQTDSLQQDSQKNVFDPGTIQQSLPLKLIQPDQPIVSTIQLTNTIKPSIISPQLSSSNGQSEQYQAYFMQDSFQPRIANNFIPSNDSNTNRSLLMSSTRMRKTMQKNRSYGCFSQKSRVSLTLTTELDMEKQIQSCSIDNQFNDNSLVQIEQDSSPIQKSQISEAVSPQSRFARKVNRCASIKSFVLFGTEPSLQVKPTISTSTVSQFDDDISYTQGQVKNNNHKFNSTSQKDILHNLHDDFGFCISETVSQNFIQQEISQPNYNTQPIQLRQSKSFYTKKLLNQPYQLFEDYVYQEQQEKKTPCLGKSIEIYQDSTTRQSTQANIALFDQQSNKDSVYLEVSGLNENQLKQHYHKQVPVAISVTAAAQQLQKVAKFDFDKKILEQQFNWLRKTQGGGQSSFSERHLNQDSINKKLLVTLLSTQPNSSGTFTSSIDRHHLYEEEKKPLSFTSYGQVFNKEGNVSNTRAFHEKPNFKIFSQDPDLSRVDLYQLSMQKNCLIDQQQVKFPTNYQPCLLHSLVD